VTRVAPGLLQERVRWLPTNPRPTAPMIRMQRTGCLLSIVLSVLLTIALNVCIRMF
jgi:hypothetical protein